MLDYIILTIEVLILALATVGLALILGAAGGG